MTDDHFKIITEAHMYITGNETKFWTPGFSEAVSKRSMLYPYLHYLLFSSMDSVGWVDPQFKMYVVRFLHGIYSLLTIFFSYKITLLLSNKRIAGQVALIAALLWFMPMMSVRNLIEVVSIPLLMGGTYLALLGHLNLRKSSIFLFAGIVLGYAFSIRYQTAAFTGGLGIFFVLQRNFKAATLMTLGFMIPLFLNHYVLESLVFGFEPFEKILNYVNFNVSNATEYINGPWYNFILLFLGLFIPPFSFILLFGSFKVWKKHLFLFLPFFLFMVFHSVFPGKQERFIFPAVMYFPILGLIGYDELVKNGKWWSRNKKFFRISWKVFWVINFILLIPITFTYSKRSKVEAMYYLNHVPDEEKNSMVFCGGSKSDILTIPAFYANIKHYPVAYRISSEEEMETFKEEISELDREDLPDYLFVFEHDQKEERLRQFESTLPRLTYETTIEASFIDQLMHWLNPKNKNYNIDIYKID